jgi:glycosyltransferase involved in cell wall biosynthesis
MSKAGTNQPMVLELCLSDGYGGLELYMLKASLWYARQDRCIAVISKRGILAEKFPQADIPFLRLYKRNHLFPWFAARELAKIIDEKKVDVMHMHWAKDLNLAILAKRMANRPVKLVYTRQMEISRDKHDLYHKWQYRYVDLYITITQKLRDQALQFLPLPTMAIVNLYHGVTTSEKIQDKDCSAWPDYDDAIKILLLGRIEIAKGQHILVDALQRMDLKGVKATALIAGPVMDQKYFDNLIMKVNTAGLSTRVKLIGGFVDPVPLRKCADIVVLTTYAETFGLVLIEAMRSNVTVIGTDAGGVPEIIKHGKTGLLFKPGDAEDLANKLIELCNDAVYRTKLAAAGKEYADEHFDEENHFKKLNGLFADLMYVKD